MLALLLCIYFLATVGSSATSKLTEIAIAGRSTAKYSMFLILNGSLACLVFWTFNKFSIALTRDTLIFAAIYSVVVAGSLILRMVAYSIASASGVNIIMNGCGLICTAIVGTLLFSEEISLTVALRILLMVSSILITFVDARRAERKNVTETRTGAGFSGTLGLAVVMLLLIVVISANTIVLKYFTLSDSVADENSFFFFTNIFLVLGSVCVFVFETVRKKGRVGEVLTVFKPRALIGISGGVVSANISSVTSVSMIALMQISVYTPVTSAIGVISGVAVSLIFREKLGIFSYLSAALALIAVIL